MKCGIPYRKAGPEDETVRVLRVVFDRARAFVDARQALERANRTAAVVPGVRAALACVAVVCAEKLLDSAASSYSRAHLETHKRDPFMFKLFSRLLALFALLLIPVVALAQAGSLPAELPLDQAFAQLGPIITSLKGAGALGIAVAVTQILLLVARTPLANFAGKWKLVVIAGLSTVTTYLGLVSAGAPWLAALLMGPIMASLQVFAHQLFVNFKAPADPPA